MFRLWSTQFFNLNFLDIFRVLPIEGKIKVLDVGSCFNPFADYNDFLAVGIDICPANPVSLFKATFYFKIILIFFWFYLDNVSTSFFFFIKKVKVMKISESKTGISLINRELMFKCKSLWNILCFFFIVEILCLDITFTTTKSSYVVLEVWCWAIRQSFS